MKKINDFQQEGFVISSLSLSLILRLPKAFIHVISEANVGH